MQFLQYFPFLLNKDYIIELVLLLQKTRDKLLIGIIAESQVVMDSIENYQQEEAGLETIKFLN